MGLEDVTEDILNEAEQKSNQIMEEAEEEAEEIIEEAEEEAEQIKQETEEEIEEKKESFSRKSLSNARMKAKELKLGEKQEQLDQVFDRFHEKIENLDEDERENFVENCRDKANFKVGKVIGSAEFEDAVSGDFEEKEVGGIILESEDGERRMDFTFKRIAKNYRENLRKDVSEVLFE